MDFEGWMELSELYLSQADYEKAAFCVEELILNNPNNHLFHQRYAECSQKLAASKSKSKVEHVSIARKAIAKLDDQFKKAKSGTQSIHEAAMNSLLDSLV
ncbi:EMC2 [Bugula neritina]|uniref:ER membrane protein complex subunit 2 n=1 Tax=Bugula neritina TaxID=10212 RepID=A0A7J7JT80_BUGNE|nr:EMC2 [Bugula neritina]